MDDYAIDKILYDLSRCERILSELIEDPDLDLEGQKPEKDDFKEFESPQDIEEFRLEVSVPFSFGLSRTTHIPAGVEIIRVPKDCLGYRVLGRAFPRLGLIEIADDLHGNDFEEVKTHELMHMENPTASEYEIRALTRIRLPFQVKWD